MQAAELSSYNVVRNFLLTLEFFILRIIDFYDYCVVR